MTSASYNVAGQPTGLTYGSTDSDSFNYDSNTSRTTAFHLPTMNGTLTWNANGSLGAMSITDQINPPNAQSCNFTHDDLSRVASVNCGPIWSQTFSYDAFGNISKSGTSSFQPTYSSTTNRMTSLPGFTPTYDANGNLLNDSLHIYTWDAEGRPVTVDSVGLTYDALGRMVEQNRSGVYSQIVYAPTGNKLAIMSGQTLQKAFVPLIAGAQAVYTLAGLAYYRHPDWLGSSRLASTAGQSVYYEGAYAPFGESYAELGSTDRSFTGQNQSTVVGLYDFLFREYSPVQGRWVSPDPLGVGAVSSADPQSWNRYGYVAGNPLNAVDPLGLVLKHSDLSTSSWWRPFGTSYASAYNPFSFFPGALNTIGGSWVLHETVTSSTVGGITSPGTTAFFWENVPSSGTPVVSGITFTQTSATTWTLKSPHTFSQTVKILKDAGFVEHWQDYLDFNHPGKLDLRDMALFCSAHAAVAKSSGQNGQPTTGDVHLDTVNPWAIPWPGDHVPFAAHTVLDQLNVYPGSSACQ